MSSEAGTKDQPREDALKMTDEQFKALLVETEEKNKEARRQGRIRFNQKRMMTKDAFEMTDDEFKKECDRVQGNRLV